MTRYTAIMMTRRLLGFFALVLLAICARAPAQATPLAEELRTRIERALARQSIVGLAAAIAEDGRLVYAGAFGFEDRERRIPATEATMFRWASVSKPLTAVAAMQLAEDGRLDLDADVRVLVPEFPQKPWTITTRQLLCHQGGVVHYANGPVIRTKRQYADEHPFRDVINALDTFKESPLVCEPGTAHRYTTHGYILVSAVVQRAAGEPFAELVRRRIAEPLGITTLRPDEQWEDIPNRAVGYRRVKVGPPVPSTNTDVSWKLGGGGFISNASDMARFGAGLLGDRLVKPATRAAMWADQPTADGKPTGYGLGFRVDRRAGKPEISHSGAQEKTATFLLILPEAEGGGFAVAVMCNTEDTSLAELARDLADRYAHHRSSASSITRP